MEVDLHSHSIYSDGTETPENLLQMAITKGLKYFAITDHDNIEGAKELIALKKEGITLYSGVELSAKAPKGQLHILGYNFDLYNESLNKRLAELKTMSKENMKLYLKKLKEDHNIVLPKKDIQQLLSKKGKIGRPSLALLLVRHGYCSSISEAFAQYLADEKIQKIKKTIPKEECIKLINDAGGIAVLAHPWSLLLSEEELYKEVAYLASIGLKGIETIHSMNTKEQRKFYHKLALEFDLIETGWTDFHGQKVKPTIHLGSGINNSVNINEKDITLPSKVQSRY